MANSRQQAAGWAAVACLWPMAFCTFLIAAGCGQGQQEEVVLKPAPEFQPDSAFGYIAQQVAFGPRVPGTEAHRQCGDFLVSRLKAFGAEVTEQSDSVTLHGGRRLPMRNIIGSFNPEAKRRVLLCAHWDTRHVADRDSADAHLPIQGANDGGSGVGVLLEVARQLGQRQTAIGVDIVLFDAEDQGRAEEEGDPTDPEHYYCMGSRHWAANPHRQGYTAMYGILLDMVGEKGAVFTLEGQSFQSAEKHVRTVWGIAHRLGYSDHFRYNRTRPIIDDHTYINELAGIPTMVIIQYDPATPTNFGSYWHTHRDNLSVIDRATLKAVGQTVLQAVFNE